MNTSPGNLPEIVFDTDTSFTPKAVGQLVKLGQLRKLAPKLYTSNLADAPEAVVSRHLFTIAGHFYPGAVLGWRSAFEEAPSPEGKLYLSYHRTRRVSLPGHTLKLIEGPGALPGDRPYLADLLIASPARAMLENLAAAKRREQRALPPAALQERLCVMTEVERGRLRERAREFATQYGWEDEFRLLEELLHAAAAKSDRSAFKSAWQRFRDSAPRPGRLRESLTQVGGALRRAAAEPNEERGCDVDRLRQFQALFRVLREHTYKARPLPDVTSGWRFNRAFFETWFSTFLAGVEFDIAAARRVVIDGKPLADRPLDSNAMLHTFRVLSDDADVGVRPADGAEFLQLLCARHRAMFPERDTGEAGCLRQPHAHSVAGQLAPELVRGTLLKGFELYRELQEPFTRAAFMLYLVRETHPFDEGSGRLARIMMNAELSAAGEMRILIPPVFAGDYWLALRALARDGDPEPFVRLLTRAHAFSAAIDFGDYDATLAQLENGNAFMPPDRRIRIHEA